MRHCIDFRDFVLDGNKLWVSPRSFNGLLKLDINQINSEYIAGFEDTMQTLELHGPVIETEEKIYFIPSLGRNMDIYDKKTRKIESVCIYQEDMEWHCLSAYLVKRKIILLPFLIDYIVCYDIDTGEISKITEWEVRNIRKFTAEGNFFCGSATVRGDYLYAASQRHEGIMRINIEDLSIEWIDLGKRGFAFSTLIDDGNFVWLAANNCAAFIRWNIETNESVLFNDFPKHYIYNLEKGIPFCNLIDCKDRILAVAVRSNISLWLDKNTGKIYECQKLKQDDNISINSEEVYRLAKKISEDTILLVSCKDQSIIQYNWVLDKIRKDSFELTPDIQVAILETKLKVTRKNNSSLIIEEGMITLESYVNYFACDIDRNYGEDIVNKQKEENRGPTIGSQIFEMVKNELEKESLFPNKRGV